jgi:hypothetical protein
MIKIFDSQYYYSDLKKDTVFNKQDELKLKNVKNKNEKNARKNNS